MIRNAITRGLHRAEDWIFARPRLVLGVILLGTLGFASQIPQLRIWTDFADLLPQSHPYIQVYDEIKEDFGGANAIVFAIEVEDGSIFNNDTLALIHQATQGIDAVPSVNHHRLRSLTHRTVRSVHLSPSGNFASDPYYETRNAPYSQTELERMRARVTAAPRVYGPLVSEDMSAALIKAQLNENDLDYEKTFAALLQMRDRISAEGHRIHMSGHPVLIGWVYTYLSQIVLILVSTLALLVSLLVLHFRRLYGIALPLLGIGLSSIWGLGFMATMGFNLEPLSLPIPFLIAARAMSHGVQLVARYYEELAQCHDGRLSARRALDALFRPGSLAIIVDAVGIGALILGTAPFNHKLGMSAGCGALSVLFTVQDAAAGAADPAAPGIVEPGGIGIEILGDAALGVPSRAAVATVQHGAELAGDDAVLGAGELDRGQEYVVALVAHVPTGAAIGADHDGAAAADRPVAVVGVAGQAEHALAARQRMRRPVAAAGRACPNSGVEVQRGDAAVRAGAHGDHGGIVGQPLALPTGAAVGGTQDGAAGGAGDDLIAGQGDGLDAVGAAHRRLGLVSGRFGRAARQDRCAQQERAQSPAAAGPKNRLERFLLHDFEAMSLCGGLSVRSVQSTIRWPRGAPPAG